MKSIHQCARYLWRV